MSETTVVKENKHVIRVKYRYRVVFEKVGVVRFIGHLDLQTLMQRSIKRAGLPIAYSLGFSPHQLISFGQPLPLGMTSHCEIVEMEFLEEVEPNVIIEKMNKALPDGLRVLEVRQTEKDEKGAAATIRKAVYRVAFPFSEQWKPVLDSLLDEMMSAEEIQVMKKTKGGNKLADIRQDIFQLKNSSDYEKKEIVVIMELSTGSVRNLKPKVVAEYIMEKAEIPCSGFEISYERLSFTIENVTVL